MKAKLCRDNIKFNDIDGVRVTTKHGWWLLRASNTQNCLVLRVESMKKEEITLITKELRDFLRKFNITFA